MPTLEQHGDRFVVQVETVRGPKAFDVTLDARRRIMGLVNGKLSEIEAKARKLNLPESEVSEFVAYIRSFREDPGL